MADVQKDLEEKVKVRPSKDRQTYLLRVVETIEEFDDTEWDELNEDTQLWYNKAIKARDADKELPEVPGYKAADSDEEEEEEAPAPKKKAAAKEPAPKRKAAKAAESSDEEEEEDEPEPAPKRGRKSKAADDEEEDEPAPKKAAKTVNNKQVGRRSSGAAVGNGVQAMIKRMLIKDINMPKDEIKKKLEAKNLRVSDQTVSTQRTEFRTSVRVLQDEGLLKRNLI